MNKIQKATLAFLSSSLSGDIKIVKENLPLSEKEWMMLYLYASKHGVLGIVFHQIKKLDDNLLPPKEILMKIYGNSIQQVMISRRQKQIISELSSVLIKNGIKCKVLKGIAFAQYYNNPELRVCCDFDCFLGDDFEVGNLMFKKIGAEFEKADYKHVPINFKGFVVENHRYLTNFDNTENGIRVERYLRMLLREECKKEYLANIFIPNDRFNIVFMLKHALQHFLNEGLTLRHLYDWCSITKNC